MPPQKPAKPIMDVQPPVIETHAAPALQPEDQPADAANSKQSAGVSSKSPRPKRGGGLTVVVVLTILATLTLAGVAVYLYYHQKHTSSTASNSVYSY